MEGHELMLRPERYGPPAAPYAPMHMRPMPLPPEPEEQSVLASVFRHIWLMVLAVGICLSAALVYLKVAPKLYTSTCKVYIEQTPGPKVLTETIGNVQGGNYLSTQCDVLVSTPLFNRLLERGEIDSYTIIPKDHAKALQWLRKYVTADVDRKTDEIDAAVTSPDPDQSSQLVNLLVDTYRGYVGKKNGANTDAVLKQLEPERQRLQADFDQTKQAMADWRLIHPNQSVETNNATPVQQARLAAAIQQESTVHFQLLTAKETWGAGHPQVQKLEALEALAHQEYEDAEHDVEKANKSTTEYLALQAHSTEISQNLKTLTDRVDELKIEQKLSVDLNDVSVIEAGPVPVSPSSPKTIQSLALALVAGLILGTSLALMRDRMDGRIRSPEEIQNIIGLPILGVIPHMPGRRTAVARAMAVHLDPRSTVAEAYRTVRTAIYFGAGSVRARTLLVTSPQPGDGKTTNASNLAIAIAQTGRSVLLLDADFRKPTQHKNLDVKDAVGLSSVLAGIASLDQAIQHTGVEGLDILPCGAIPENPSEILNSQEFGDLVDRLALKYDHILFDSPPINLVTDARILGAVCDGTILVLRAGKTTRKAAEHARNALLSVGANVLGVIVNDTTRGKGYDSYGGTYYGHATPTPASPPRTKATTGEAYPIEPAEDESASGVMNPGGTNGFKPTPTPGGPSGASGAAPSNGGGPAASSASTGNGSTAKPMRANRPAVPTE